MEVNKALGAIIGGRSNEHLEPYIASLEFSSIKEVLQQTTSPAVFQSQKEETEGNMVQNIQSMEKKIRELEKSHTLLQYLQMFKQLEYLSAKRGEFVLNTVKHLVDNRLTSMTINVLRDLARVGWAVYRYPVLGLLKMGWAHAKEVIPAAAGFFDGKIDANESLPNNVTTAQSSRLNAPCLRVSLEFPEQSLGDGDGLPSVKVTDLHGLYVNDTKVNNLGDQMLFRRLYPADFAGLEGNMRETIKMRSRLIGYDTQESPREQHERSAKVPQFFWREGRQFLEQRLEELRAEIPIGQARILGDCYGVDLYGRMLLDIRAVYDAADQQPVPTLARLKIAEDALATGYAFPTNNYLVTANLWATFQEAIRDERGGFGSGRPFVHPLKCRRERYDLERRASGRHRMPYRE